MIVEEHEEKILLIPFTLILLVTQIPMIFHCTSYNYTNDFVTESVNCQIVLKWHHTVKYKYMLGY